MRRRYQFIGIVAAVILLAAFAWWKFYASGPEPPTTPREGLVTLTEPPFPMPGATTGSSPDAKVEKQEDKELPDFPSLQQLETSLNEMVSVKFPKAKPYEHFTNYSFSGEPSSYSFSYFDGEGNPPSREELLNTIRQANETFAEGMEIKRRGFEAQNNNIMREGVQLLLEADNLRTQENRFFVIEIGSNYDKPPILMYRRGIPAQLVALPNVLALLNEQYPKEYFEVSKYYNAGIDRFVFEIVSKEGKYYYVDSLSMKVVPDIINLGSPPEKKGDRERADRIHNQWIAFLEGNSDLIEFDIETLKPIQDK